MVSEQLDATGGDPVDVLWAVPPMETRLADHTACHADAWARPAGTVMTRYGIDIPVDFILSFFPHGAGIKNNHICLQRIGRVSSA